MFHYQVMIDATNTVYYLTILALAYISVLSLFAIWVARNSIYSGSGDPVSMAQNLWKLVSSQSQIVFGVFGLTILVILVIETEVSTDVIFPLIGTLIGYILGREFKGSESRALYPSTPTSTSTSTSSTSTSTTKPP